MRTLGWIHVAMRRGAVALAIALAATAHAEVYERGGPSTTNNDDTCDIAVLPAATLLLPYFEVDLTTRGSDTTQFTITNVTALEQIARVTLWTDLAYPVIYFHIFLTGYDVQTIDLYDFLAEGKIAPPLGTGYGRPGSPEGQYSTDHANPLVDETTCRHMARNISGAYLSRVQRAFTAGEIGRCRVGTAHEKAAGYVTVDVNRNCDLREMTDALYYAHELGFDNVLTGDYQQVNARQRQAQGSPLVHIRAVPEGGRGESDLPRTFYSSQQPGMRPRDARQPLPSAFVAHWIGGADASADTKLKIWRESAGPPPCGGTPEPPPRVAEVVRFDQHANLSVAAEELRLPSASLMDVNGSGSQLPEIDGAVAGWLYLNLDDLRRDGFANQGWVVSSMRAAESFSVDSDATALGNGCSPAAPLSVAHTRGAALIEPARDVDETTTSAPSSVRNDDSCDIALLPAATLLLPYFEVDLASGTSRNTTLFTVTNTSPSEQIAQVTLWTDYAFPILTFSIVLAGYEMQSISLYDVLAFGSLGPASAGRGGALSRPNPALDLSACGSVPRELSPAYLLRVQQAFTRGVAPAADVEPHCRRIGGDHGSLATGYATIDLVGACTMLDPSHPLYHRAVIRFDNVLTGDYQQVNGAALSAHGGPLVHIRAIPEGGNPHDRARGGRDVVTLPRTFYGSYQPKGQARLDARQPLPATFAVRYFDRGADAETSLKIWLEGSATSTCAAASDGDVAVMDVVTFDERENAVSAVTPCGPILCPLPIAPRLPATGSHPFRGGEFPIVEAAPGGWVYLNLSGSTDEARQGWVVSSIATADGYASAFDATALGNGCSPPIGQSEVTTYSGAVIGPAPNTNPR